MEFAGKKVTVIGFGREGLAASRFMVERGARVTVSDARKAEQLADNIGLARGLPIDYALGGNRVEDTVNADLVVVSPGVPLDIPAIVAARAAGVPITSETKLFVTLCRAPIIGITGSSGKTTTTSLVGEMLRGDGRHVLVGGNIGAPLLGRLEEITASTLVVMELSSFQLLLMEKSPHVAAITNLAPNHLDRHPHMEHYLEAKKNIVRFQKPSDFAVLNYGNSHCRAIAGDCAAKVLFFSSAARVESGSYVRDGRIVVTDQGMEQTVCEVDGIKLRGWHNVENVLTACAIALACGVRSAAMAAVATSFQGVQHRLELVRQIGGVQYVNDSIATSPDRTIAALNSFVEPIVLLAGGRDKHLPLEELAGKIHGKCKQVILFGEAALLLGEAIEQWQRQHGARALSVVRTGSMADAVKLASELAVANDVVLLSPACTSYDAFLDFEERGKEFRRLVVELAKQA
ncbi:MAG: UDP-N-acetylmuramoyl-L-alanine--D-glutamate ligase [Dehalococcoidia bacterium]|nr:UDP-N-acetylmuramoyl-L-alanine--D-glutamate ligase [Dehalococcoidia bacterium]